MRLAELTALFGRLDFPGPEGRGHPPRDHVRALEGAVRAGLADDELLLDLFALEIERRDGAPELAPFHVLPELGVRLAFAYWRPGRAAGAHEHSDWTVTAVVHNTLDVATFDWDATARARRLVPKRLFSAEAGRVGHIYGPCIHDPRNPTGSWSISLHLFGPHDGPVIEAQVGPIEGLTPMAPRAEPDDALSAALLAHEQECVRRAQIDAIGRRGPQAAALLARLHARGDAGTRRRAARALGRTEDLGAHTVLARRWAGVDLDVAPRAGRAELVARCGGRAQVLLRVDAWARPALRAVSAARELRPTDIPGLAEAAQLTLARALVDWGTFQPFEAQEN
ncbi:hypothetical protein WME95_15185 [Sorangium sp. So ce327]|uniref:hypothetical protein n=1 Tax=Sorangium sp. So ce327 TaxID=3133301 RepID=UPI003F5E1D5D